MNPKSDVAAKAAFKCHLEKRGFTDVRVLSAPADISATRDGVVHLFELKLTAKPNDYFGAATITEWEAALRDPLRFRFVVARCLEGDWRFREYTPEEFIQFSDIPPFKVYFRIPADGVVPKPTDKRRRAITATLKNLGQLIEFRAQLRRDHNGETTSS